MIISTIVALTLSPMMASKLLKPVQGVAGWPEGSPGISSGSNGSGRVLDATLNARPAVYLVWCVVTILTVPMF